MYCMLASKEMVLPLTALSTEQEQKLVAFVPLPFLRCLEKNKQTSNITVAVNILQVM